MTYCNQLETTSGVRWRWLFDAPRDMMFFFLPVPLAFLVFAASQSSQISSSTILYFVALNAFGLGPAHQGATWFHFLDKENRGHYFSSPKKVFIFAVGPALILALTILAQVVNPMLVPIIYALWSIQHLVQQNVGILLLYHNHNCGEAVVDRVLETKTLHATGILFSAIFFWRVLLAGIYPAAAACFFTLLSLWTSYYVVRYMISMVKQVKGGAYLNAPAAMFWMISILSLIPFAFFGKEFGDAFLIPLVIHWCQYLGLNYMLVKRRYEKPGEGQLPVKQPILLYALMTLMGIALVFGIGSSLENPQLKAMSPYLIGTLFGLNMVHYYLDAFIWRFRDEYPRKAFLPHLKTRAPSSA